MTIQDLGSVGELLAAVATIATLIHLALQIRSEVPRLKRRGLDRAVGEPPSAAERPAP